VHSKVFYYIKIFSETSSTSVEKSGGLKGMKSTGVEMTAGLPGMSSSTDD